MSKYTSISVPVLFSSFTNQRILHDNFAIAHLRWFDFDDKFTVCAFSSIKLEIVSIGMCVCVCVRVFDTIFCNIIFVHGLVFWRKTSATHCHCHYEWNTIKRDYLMDVTTECIARSANVFGCVRAFCSCPMKPSKLWRLHSFIAYMKTNEQTKALKAIFQYWICLNRISLWQYCCCCHCHCLFVVPLSDEAKNKKTHTLKWTHFASIFSHNVHFAQSQSDSFAVSNNLRPFPPISYPFLCLSFSPFRFLNYIRAFLEPLNYS